jgi:DNA end-binding protein Ku
MQRSSRGASARGTAVWKGRIAFGLVGIPVELVPAVDTKEHIGFHLLHRKDRAPIQYHKYCSKEGVAVPDDEVVRGYETSKGKWAVVEKEEIEGARRDSGEDVEAHVLEILQFVTAESLDPVSFAHPYHVVPGEGGRKSFAVLRAALADAGRVGLGRLRLRATAHLGALLPTPRGLSIVLLRPFEEIAAAPAVSLPAPQAGETKMARLLIDQMAGDEIDPAQYPDRYRAALRKLLASKRTVEGAAGEEPASTKEKGGEVVDLMAALKASLAARGGKREAARKSAKSSSGRGRPRAA